MRANLIAHRSRRAAPPCSSRSLLWLIATASWLIATSSAGAATVVYHSAGDDGTPPFGPAIVAEGGVRSIYLYIDGGGAASAAGEACHAGAGDEVCGYELRLTGQGGLTLVGFNPEATADLVVNSGASEIVLNGLDTVGTTPGPKRIGELLVNAAPAGSLELTSGEAIGADLASEGLVTATLVTVPEPGLLASLGAGIALLELMRRRRAGR
jgi:hypothetical protein